MKPVYYKHIDDLKLLISQKTAWRAFSKSEKLLVENSIRLVSVMHEMCKIELVEKPEREGELERVNEKMVKKAVQYSDKLVVFEVNGA